MKYEQLEEGDIFSIQLADDVWTIGQLCNLFTRGKKYAQYTLAFFNHKLESEEAILKEVGDLDLHYPISIATINGHPLKNYGLKIVAKRDVLFKNAPNFKDDISIESGSYRQRSLDFVIILKPFFGVKPWDSYKDGFLEEFLLEGVKKRDDIKYMKDYTIDELKNILPSDNFKLNELLKKHGLPTYQVNNPMLASFDELPEFKPTLKWKENIDDEDGMYSKVVVDETNEVLDRFIQQLRNIGQDNIEAEAKTSVKETILELNQLNKKYNGFIESVERDELCDFIEQAISILGISTEEDITEEWREW